MKKLMLLFAAGSVVGSTIAYANLPGTEGALRERHFTAEVEPGGTIQVGVKLPNRAKIAKTRVYVDSQDKGDRVGEWATCDVKKKTCSIGDSAIVRFHRSEEERWQVLAVDVKNDSGQARWVRLHVTYQRVSGKDETGCGRVQPRCGFSNPVSQ